MLVLHTPCLQEPAKQAWLKDLNAECEFGKLDDDLHIFTQMEDLHKDRAYCMAHGSMCGIKGGRVGPAIFHVGFSCKTLSRLFNGSHGQSRAELVEGLIREGKGGTGATFSSLIAYLSEHPVGICIFENVVDILRPEHADPIMEAFNNVQMKAAMRLLSSEDFGIPQTRKRVFGVALNYRLCDVAPEEAEVLANRIMDDACALASGAGRARFQSHARRQRASYHAVVDTGCPL